MKITLTKADYKRLISGLYWAAEWEDSVAAIWPNEHPEWRKARRASSKYRQLRSKLFKLNVEISHANPNTKSATSGQ